MTQFPSPHPRRAASLAGLLSAAALLVALKGATAPPPRPVSLARPPLPGAPAPTGPAPAGQTPAARPRTVLGQPIDVGYGTVQVRLTVAGSRITGVSAVQLPTGGRSSDISSYAAPTLRTEVLAAQSARIDTVSGASFTSQGYAQSVQSALDAAHL